MEFKFLGIGQAYSVDFDNTSAYLIEDKTLILIDCGETVFTNIKKMNLLNDIDDVYILITHTHSDHICSIGSFLLYLYSEKKIKPKIVLSKYKGHTDSVLNVIKLFSVKPHKFTLIYDTDIDNIFNSFKTVRYKKQNHYEDMTCTGLIFETDNGIIYYSGDTNDISILKKIIKHKDLYRIYIDTTNVDKINNAHMSLLNLDKIIPDNLRNKVYCMHFNDRICVEDAKKLGFNVVESIINEI